MCNKKTWKSIQEQLTEKETKTLKYISQDMTNLEISEKMNLSKRTVEYHISIILQKFHCASRVGAVVAGVKRGIITL